MIWKKVILNHNKVILKAIQANTRNLSISRVLAENHYEVLGLKRDATQAEIKNAYFKLSKIYHPDKISATDENLAKFRAIITAYEVLGNEQARKLYDGGYLEDRKKMEEEQAKDPTDPIIKFYKERHERSKKVLDSDSWTQEVYESTRKSYLTKEERFGNWKPEEKETTEQYVPALTYALFSVLIMTLFYTSELENHKVKKFWDGLFK